MRDVLNIGELESFARFVRLCAGRNGQFLNLWRDSTGQEIDLLLDLGTRLTPIEIKSGMTVASDFFQGLEYWRLLSGKPDAPGALIYAGDRAYRRRGFIVHPWSAL